MKQRTFFSLIFFVSLLFFCLGNSTLAVTDPVESNYALTAKEMVLSGDWISPRIYGIFWYDKPIFLYWLLCLSYSVFGFTEFASRFPSAVFGAMSVVLGAWFMVRQTGRQAAGLLFAAMVGTSLEVWAISHSIITDQMLFFFTSGTMFCTYIGLREKKQHYIIAAYALAGFAVLTKGPVGLVLPGLFFLIFAAIQRNLDYVKRLFPPLGIVAFLIISLSWYGTMYAKHGMDFIDGFLGFNNVIRATVSEHPEANVWYYYLVLVPVSLLPWSGPCLYALWKRRGRYDEYVFMTVWAIGTVLFYTAMATKYPTYSYIANMPLLYLGARLILSLYEKEKSRLWFIVTIPGGLFLLLWFAASFFVKKTPFPIESLTALLVFVPMAILLLALAQWQRAWPAVPTVLALGTAVVYLILTYQVLTPFFAYRSSTVLVPAMSSLQGKIYFFEEYSTSLDYYTGITPVWTSKPDFDEFTKEKRDAVWNRKHVYPTEDGDDVARRIRQGEELTFIVYKSRLDDFSTSQFAGLTKKSGQYGPFSIYTTP